MEKAVDDALKQKNVPNQHQVIKNHSNTVHLAKKFASFIFSFSTSLLFSLVEIKMVALINFRNEVRKILTWLAICMRLRRMSWINKAKHSIRINFPKVAQRIRSCRKISIYKLINEITNKRLKFIKDFKLPKDVLQFIERKKKKNITFYSFSFLFFSSSWNEYMSNVRF